MKYTVRESGESARNIEVPFIVQDGMTFEGKEIYGTVSNRSHGKGLFYVRKVEESSESPEGS